MFVDRNYSRSPEGIIRAVILVVSFLLCLITGLYHDCLVALPGLHTVQMSFCRSAFEEPFINSSEYSGVVFLTGMSASSLIGTSMFYLLHCLARDRDIRILGEAVWSTSCCILMGVGALWMTDTTMKGFSSGPIVNKYSQGFVSSILATSVTILYLIEAMILVSKYRGPELQSSMLLEEDL